MRRRSESERDSGTERKVVHGKTPEYGERGKKRTRQKEKLKRRRITLITLNLEQKKETDSPLAKKRMEGKKKRKRNERRMGRRREGQRTETRRARGTHPDGAALWEKGKIK